MKAIRGALLLTILSLTACGSREVKPAGTPAGTPAEEPAPPSSLLALPVTAPIRARERLLHDLKGHNSAARQRARQMEEVFEQNR